jgi:hypothetical protein
MPSTLDYPVRTHTPLWGTNAAAILVINREAYSSTGTGAYTSLPNAQFEPLDNSNSYDEEEVQEVMGIVPFHEVAS